jgi:hypothetical protein
LGPYYNHLPTDANLLGWVSSRGLPCPVCGPPVPQHRRRQQDGAARPDRLGWDLAPRGEGGGGGDCRGSHNTDRLEHSREGTHALLRAMSRLHSASGFTLPDGDRRRSKLLKRTRRVCQCPRSGLRYTRDFQIPVVSAKIVSGSWLETSGCPLDYPRLPRFLRGEAHLNSK